MSIVTGQTAQASDFISASLGASSSGKVPKLNSNGKLDGTFTTLKFGGTGADGALSITSGTTTLSLGNAKVFMMNYSSISITGTGKLAFSNPNVNGTKIVLKSTGDVTLTSSSAPMIDVSGMGAAANNPAYMGGFFVNSQGNGGSGALYSTVAQGATGGSMSLNPSASTIDILAEKHPCAIIGSGGGNGGAYANGGTASGGSGGAGGGCLIIECGGALNFTTANGISCAGLNGGNGSATGSSNCGSGSGGGGGGGGSVIIFYNILTANSGTVNINGGNGGSGQFPGSGNAESTGGGGGAGKSSGGSSGNQGGGGAQGGQSGGQGFSLAALNTEFT